MNLIPLVCVFLVKPERKLLQWALLLPAESVGFEETTLSNYQYGLQSRPTFLTETVYRLSIKRVKIGRGAVEFSSKSGFVCAKIGH